MRRGNRWASEATLVEYPENKVQNEKNKKQEKKKRGWTRKPKWAPTESVWRVWVGLLSLPGLKIQVT